MSWDTTILGYLDTANLWIELLMRFGRYKTAKWPQLKLTDLLVYDKDILEVFTNVSVAYGYFHSWADVGSPDISNLKIFDQSS